MVLQRQAPIVVTGRGAAGGEVRVSLGLQEQAATVDADERWSVTFDPMPAGGPHRLKSVDGTAEVILDDVLIGDVWLFSGQSNMQMGVGEADGGREAIASASAEMPVRLLVMPKAGADTPQEDLGAEWKHCSPESLRKFSAVAWFFARHLRQDPALANVPLGLVDSSFGGTSVEAWTPEGTLPEIPADQISGSMFGIPPGSLFNRMIAPLLAYRIKGVAWYQGEANAGHPTVYSGLLQNLMVQWRQQWNQPAPPFFIIQLPAFEGRMGGLDFGWLREAQARACRETPLAWLVVTHDTTDGFDLHPREKEEIGRRLSLLARRHVYGQDVPADSPRFESLSVDGDRAVVTFDQPVTVPDGEPVAGFALAGADGEYRHATASIAGREVTLRADGVPAPLSVRYAWGALPDANLTSCAGLPVVPFRTDDQAPQTLAFQPLPTVYRIETPVYALEIGRGGSVASLVVDGRQFLSHEPGGATRIPGAFGPRNLAHTRVVGPRRLVLSDGGAELELACGNESMTWTLTNHGNDPIELHFDLAPQVELTVTDARAELSRGGTALRIEGIDRTEDNRRIIAKAPPRGSVDLRWTLRTP